MRKSLTVSVMALAAAVLGACSPVYYWQAMSGHLELMGQRRPVVDVMADPETPTELRLQLLRAERILEFAHSDLDLPDNGSYTSYADTGRQFVVWNVFAADEFSLDPQTWCFPVAGCVSYRGYFAREAAERFAARLDGRGLDTFVGGVSAYSTLGRFRDPLLNNMIGLQDYRLAALLIHELAHQKLYVRNDSQFNESFASFVEQAGVRAWLRREAADQQACEHMLFWERRRSVQSLLSAARDQLMSLYGSERNESELRVRKADVFWALQADYLRLRESWRGPPYFDAWFDDSPNNARLVALSTYDGYLPAFRQLFSETGQRWEQFFVRVEELAALPADERAARLDALVARATVTESAEAGRESRGECPESKGSDPAPLAGVPPRSGLFPG